MKTLAFVAMAALTAAPALLRAQEPMDLGRLIQRGGVYVHPETLEPFTGRVETRWSASQVREQGTLVEGRWDGVLRVYYIDGQLSSQQAHEDGVLHGPFEAYYKRGQLSDRGSYRNGLLHGPYESYWARGALAERGSWTDGQKCGEWISFGVTTSYPPCPAG